MGFEILDRLLGELAETRRHFDVVAEGLRGDVRQVADGVAAVRSRLERFEAKVSEEFTETRAALAYLPGLDPETGELLALEMTPFTARRFRLERVPERDGRWLADLLTSEGEALGTRAELTRDGRLRLAWER